MIAGVTAAFARLGRLGPRALPAGLVLGLALPELAALARPLLAPSVAALLVASMVRLEPAALAARLSHPARLVAAVLWLQLAVPLLAAPMVLALPLSPGLGTALVLYAASPPILASAAYALMLGLDAALALVVMAGATLLSPLTVPPLASALLGLDLAIGTAALMARLGLLIGGTLAVAVAIRRWAGAERLDRHGASLDGVFVVVMTVFAVAIMAGVTERLIREPAMVLGIAAAAFAVNLTLQAVGLAALTLLERRAAVTLALMTGNRNMALLMAALGSTADPEVFLFFALVQVPIYTLPALLRPACRRLARPDATDRRP